ncbi:hypothetical protein [Sphingomonas sp. HMP6]|uniref:hypothetical protein n=1 Tax=Sphingomonas sp. HMP6 TaxID=1517551 RepID=UPI001596ECE9|nr:hypothetical protein [Sphingomonas sp. HMP6]BCA57672.1 hypothetical protein HMP06_0441 [Sphingomonas sp. HMP6]
MPDVPPRPSWKDWLPFIALAISILGFASWFGGSVSRDEDIARRTTILEQREDLRDRDRSEDKDKLNTIDVRTARIESKLEVLLAPKERNQ